MEALFLHLTDIHLKDERDFNVLCERNKALCNAMLVHVTNEDDTVIFICITGDITYEGTNEQYLCAELWIEDIIEKIKDRYSNINIQVVAIPGNHDCNFNDEFAETRNLLLDKIDISMRTKQKVFKSYTKIQKEYFDYINKLNIKEIGFGCKDDRIITVNEYNIENEPYTFKFHCVNSAWCSSRQEIKGKMHFFAEEHFEKKDKDIVITLVHHDGSWLDWDDLKRWEKYYKEYSDIVFVGHDHVSDYVHKDNYDQSSNYFIKGNQLYDPNNKEQSGFNVLKIDLKNNVESFFTYLWSGKIYETINKVNAKSFVKNRFYSSTVRLNDSMHGFLNELNMDLYCSNKKNLTLSDVFVYPVLKGNHTKKSNKIIQYNNEEEILDIINNKRTILISGQKEAGKTALLKNLYKLYLSNNLLPVWVDALSIRSSDVEQLNDLIKKVYGEQFDNINPEEILQDEPIKKVCIIDDFDSLSISDDSTKKLLQYLVSRFSIVIISITPAKHILNTIRNLESNKYLEDNFYKLDIRDVGSYWKRKLVEKWMKLENPLLDVEGVEFDLLRKDKIEQISNVMKNGYFRQTPLEVLLILSYLDNTTRISPDYSKFSYIYDYLIKDKLNEVSQSKTDDAAMYQTILEQLAYKMYKEAVSDCIDESFLIEVIYGYNQEYTGARGEVIDTIKLLTDSNILLKTKDNKYKFKYDYMRYYFNCSYIKSQLSFTERNGVIKELIENVTDELNYNTLLFLAFGASPEHDILPVIENYEKTLLKDYKDFKYEDSLKVMEDLEKSINQKVDRIFMVPFNKNIDELQERAAILSDRIKEELDNEETRMEDIKLDAELKEIIQLMRLAELLSEIIKNYAGRLKREPRMKIIKEIYTMIMKTFGKMLSMFNLIYGKLLKLTEEAETRDNDKRLSKSAFVNKLREQLYGLFKNYIKANIYLTAEFYKNDRISKEVLDYNNEVESDFLRMVTIQYLINTGKGNLPTDEIKKCYKGKAKIKVFSQIILKEMIAENLFAYQYEKRSKQAVCDLLNFNIKDFRIDWTNNMMVVDNEGI